MSESVPSISSLTIPDFSGIPVIGALFKDQSPYFYVVFLTVAAVWIVFHKTRLELRYRAIDNQPCAVQTAGVQVNHYRYIAMIAIGGIAGLVGSYLFISQNNLSVADMTAGRDFMGLVANIFSGWQSLGSMGAGVIFTVTQAARFYSTNASVPPQFVQILPYGVTLLVLLFVGKKVKGPETLGGLVDQFYINLQ